MNTTPLQNRLAEAFHARQKEIKEWFATETAKAPLPFYCSVDLRDAGFKIAPVDHNLFPAGFNNICPEDRRTGEEIFRKHLKDFKKVLIIPESNTSNRYYIENLYELREFIQRAGLECEVAWLGPEVIELVSVSEQKITAKPYLIQDGVISIEGRMANERYVPDFVLLNNDFSSGYPKFLDGLKQKVAPSHRLGWHSRKKSTHFSHYNRLVAEFAQVAQIDPWLLSVESHEISDVNFNESEGIDRVRDQAQATLEATQKAYDTHGIKHKPFVFVKNNSGTYGMGIMVVHDAHELDQLNRREKNKMSVGKNRSQIQSVVVQEGIPTATIVDHLAAEPVIYLIECELLGGFLRSNTERGAEENLNSQGMVFKKLCMSDLRDVMQDEEHKLEDLPVLELVYGTIARISALAAGYEMIEAQKLETRK